MTSISQNTEKSNINIKPEIKCNVFLDELLTIYKLEKNLNETLPVMIMNAKSPKIANGLTKHLKFTQEHLHRLEVLFESINQPIP
jgi:ferritin-like metal-binding protein YciE